MTFWRELHWPVQRIVKNLFLINKVFFILSIIFFLIYLQKFLKKTDFEQQTKRFSLKISEHFLKNHLLGFSEQSPEVLKALSAFHLLKKAPPTSKKQTSGFSSEEDSQKSLSYIHHRKRMESEQKMAIENLKHYQVVGIIDSKDSNSLVILKNKLNKEKIYLKKSDSIKAWTIIAIKKKYVSFEYEKDSKLVKNLFIKDYEHKKTH